MCVCICQNKNVVITLIPNFLIYRSGVYEIQEADGVAIGTKIIVHLKTECREYADDEIVKSMY